MRLLKLASCFVFALFLSCDNDDLVYFVEGQVKASEQQKTDGNTLSSNQKSFSFDLNNSEDFKSYINELNQLNALNFKIKSTVDLKSGDYSLIIDNTKYQLKNSSVIDVDMIEVADENILSMISMKLLKNKHFNLLVETVNSNQQISSDIELTLNLKGTFVGVH